MTDKPIYAWHFSDGFLRYDMSDVEVKAGLVLETDAEPEVEKQGFHACCGAHDALFNLTSKPIDNLIVSRVKLSGKIVRKDYGYEVIAAQKREHLWIADANKIVEEFALQYIEEALRQLEKANVIIGDTLYWAIENRRLLFEQGLPKDKLDEIAEYVKHAKEELEPPSSITHQSFIDDRLRWNVEDWYEYFARRNALKPHLVRGIYDTMAHIIRYSKLHFAAVSVASFTSKIQNIVEHAATKTYIEHERDVILEHISKTTGLVAMPQLPPTPEKYLEQMRKKYKMPNVNDKLHDMLMQLAPEGL